MSTSPSVKKDQLLARAASADLEPADLEEAVCEAFYAKANKLNEGGIEDQIEFIIEMLGFDEAVRIVQGAINTLEDEKLDKVVRALKGEAP